MHLNMTILSFFLSILIVAVVCVFRLNINSSDLFMRICLLILCFYI